MKQIIQDIKNGTTILEEVPVPRTGTCSVLIKTTKSLVSLGTERMIVEFGKASFTQKARQHPDKVRLVLHKIKTDGLKSTMGAVFNKLNQPLPLGYCNAGIVVEVGKRVTEFKVGDRVVSNGNHAEYVVVPKNLVAKIPNKVSDEEVAFTVIAAIVLQGIRLLNPTLGETIVVIGLGLIGLLTAELLKSNGCNVIGFDFDPEKIKIAKEKGIIVINPIEGTNQFKFVENYTNGIGCDGVIITVSSKSNEVISQAANMSRKRGRIVLIGVVGLNINRVDFYEKELSFQVSCSYGPGRYDDEYEQKGNDYPIEYVRWTEKRNFEAVLNAINKVNLNVKPFINNRYHLIDYAKIYGNISQSKPIAFIIDYDNSDYENRIETIKIQDKNFRNQKGIIGIIGAGNFTSSTLLPKLKKLNASIKYIVNSRGLSSTIMAKKYVISNSTTDYKTILKDNEVDLVFITTRHNIRASMILEVLKNNKSVFVEKPLAVNQEELGLIVEEYNKRKVGISVGFNRRFAPIAIRMKKLLGNSNNPINIVTTMNAGFIPANSWVHDMEIGGGRIIGEAYHYIDLCTYFSGSLVKSVCMNAMGVISQENTDNACILLKYENGSNAVINYFANGSRSYAKERIEVYSQERTLVMENWRKLKTYGFKKTRNSFSKQDKGHLNQFKKLLAQQQSGGDTIIKFNEIVNTTSTSFCSY